MARLLKKCPIAPTCTAMVDLLSKHECITPSSHKDKLNEAQQTDGNPDIIFIYDKTMQVLKKGQCFTKLC
eukprot:4406260-Ditylum_brightwellii.AAC.1